MAEGFTIVVGFFEIRVKGTGLFQERTPSPRPLPHYVGRGGAPAEVCGNNPYTSRLRYYDVLCRNLRIDSVRKWRSHFRRFSFGEWGSGGKPLFFFPPEFQCNMLFSKSNNSCHCEKLASGPCSENRPLSASFVAIYPFLPLRKGCLLTLIL